MNWLIVFIVSVISLSEAYRILVIFPIPGKSHSILGNGVVDTLADAGHEVTVITPFPREKMPPNIHQVNIDSTLEIMKANSKKFLGNIAELSKMTLPMHVMPLRTTPIPRQAVLHEEVQKLLNDPTQKFDVVIAEWFFTHLLAGFASFYECPLIWLSPTDPHAHVLQLVDENTHPAYTTNILSKPIPPLSFLERVDQLRRLIYTEIIKIGSYYYIEKPYYKEMYEDVFQKRGRQLPNLLDIAYNASFMFLNGQPSLGVPFKLPQNVKYIGGYHIDPKTKPLPENLQNILDNAKDGAIYFSMGSNLKSTDLPEQVKQDLVKMFGQLKQTVIWKFEEEIKDLPKNLHIIQWAPQPSILNHTNTRIFITHGGKLSTTEAVYYGTPIIGVPVFGDQFTNMNMAVSKKYALLVTFGDDLAVRLNTAIHEILSNPRYTESVKELSYIYHSLPLTPRQELAYWVEHVVRTRGALHLRSPALLVPLYQKLYLDLIAVILVILYLIKRCFVSLKNKVCGKRKQKLL